MGLLGIEVNRAPLGRKVFKARKAIRGRKARKALKESRDLRDPPAKTGETGRRATGGIRAITEMRAVWVPQAHLASLEAL